MKKNHSEKRLIIKMFLCIIYLIIITLLSVCTYHLYQKDNQILPWSEVKGTKDYSYMNISKMSEKFAYYKEQDIGIHFIIEEEDTGQWHTFLIAIKESKIDLFQEIIDYTYEKTEKRPTPIKVYGYPVIMSQEIKELAIKNINHFIPAENEVQITEENFERYLTNSYLDTTKPKIKNVDIQFSLSVSFLIITIILLLLTIINKDKIVDSIMNKMEKESIRIKRKRNYHKK